MIWFNCLLAVLAVTVVPYVIWICWCDTWARRPWKNREIVELMERRLREIENRGELPRARRHD